MCILLKLHYAKFDVSSLICSKVIEEKPLGGRLDPLGKGKVKMPEPPSIPGRPIVGGPNCPTHKLSNLLDLILKPMAFKVKSYVKDSFHFLELLPKTIDFESKFVLPLM